MISINIQWYEWCLTSLAILVSYFVDWQELSSRRQKLSSRRQELGFLWTIWRMLAENSTGVAASGSEFMTINIRSFVPNKLCVQKCTIEGFSSVFFGFRWFRHVANPSGHVELWRCRHQDHQGGVETAGTDLPRSALKDMALNGDPWTLWRFFRRYREQWWYLLVGRLAGAGEWEAWSEIWEFVGYLVRPSTL